MSRPKLVVSLAIVLVALVAAGWWAAKTPRPTTEMIAYSVVPQTAGSRPIFFHLGQGGQAFGGDIKGPMPVSMSAPLLAKRNTVKGNVETMVKLDATGSVAGVVEMYSSNVRGGGGVDEALNRLLHIAHTWKFKPATENAKPVPATVIVQVRF